VYDLYTAVNESGNEAAVCYGRGDNIHEKNIFKFGIDIETYVHALLTRVTGFTGCFSPFSTLRLIRFIKKFKPDVVHIHELHAYFVNIKPLINYLKKNKIKTVITLHCEFTYTGKCGHSVECERWQTECGDCPHLKEYPSTLFFDHTKFMFNQKKELFEDFENLTIVTPSKWLADQVKESFFKNYPVKVIYNGIDLSVFQPKYGDFRERYNISEEQKILLGVAFGWGRRKGLDVFVKLAESLTDTYKIVLVGTDDKTDAELPSNIISIHRTNNQQELAEIYTAADLFVNPTREENYPTVNMESLACGTPVLTFKTGGSPEIIDETCGSVVECDDFEAFQDEIERICTEKPYLAEACLARAKGFDMNERFREYISLYENSTYCTERTV
jgi:glycosyltransferase involved in cell wall biosynthesis